MTEDTWTELHKLRVKAQDPDGFLTWKDAAIAERLKRVAAEQYIKDARKQALEDAIAKFDELGLQHLITPSPQDRLKELLK